MPWTLLRCHARRISTTSFSADRFSNRPRLVKMTQAWNQALVRIASAKDPNALPTDDRVLFYDDRTITIYDKFAKAQYHFLVLPRIPFKLANGRDKGNPTQAPPALSTTNGKLTLGATSSNVVPASHLRNISALMTSPYVTEVLAAVREASDRVLDHIRDDMQRNHGVTWCIDRAFHAVPSMEHLHLHVASMDLVSARLKHKKHYLSFAPTVDFAQRLDDVDKMVAEGKQALPKSERAYENLLKGPLISHHTGQRFKFFPELKAHLESHWRDTVLAQGRPESHPTSPRSKRAASNGAGEHAAHRRKVECHQLESTAGPNAAESDTDEEPALPLR